MIEPVVFVMLHLVPLPVGVRLIKSQETFPIEDVCDMRAGLLNRVDPANFFYWCDEETT